MGLDQAQPCHASFGQHIPVPSWGLLEGAGHLLLHLPIPSLLQLKAPGELTSHCTCIASVPVMEAGISRLF